MIMNDKLHHKISKTLHQCISFAPLSKREYFNGRHPAVTEKLPLKNNRNATSTIMQMYKCKQIQIHTGSLSDHSGQRDKMDRVSRNVLKTVMLKKTTSQETKVKENKAACTPPHT